jgi:MFS family permease
MTGFDLLAWTTAAGGFTFGMLLSLMGSSRKTLKEWLGFSDQQAAGLLSALTLALIPFTLLGGLLVDAWGAKPVLCLGSILASLALVVLVSNSSRSYARTVWAVVIAGAGAGFLNCGTAMLMSRAFFDNPLASTNLGFIFVGLGALITPVVADLLLQFQRVGYRRTLSVFALLCLVPLVLAVSAGAEPTITSTSIVHLTVFTKPSVWLAGVVFVLYGALEGWLSSSAPGYLHRANVGRSKAGLLLAITWLVFLGARFVVAAWMQTGVFDADSGHLMMLVMAVIATVALGNLAGAERHDAVVVWFLLIGAALGPIFPTLVGFLFLYNDPQEYGTAYGLMFAVGTVGSLVVAPLYSAHKTAQTDKTVLRLLAAISLGMIGVILAAWVALR